MMGHHFKSVSVATSNENAVLGACLSTWVHVFLYAKMYFVQEQGTQFTLYPPPKKNTIKNFYVLMSKENHVDFSQK